MANILLTGGYGCIGAWIARHLVMQGRAPLVFDLREDLTRFRLVMDEEQWRQVRFVQGDVTDLAGLRSAMERHRIEGVIHLAGLQVPTCRADPILGAKVNVLGMLAVFEAVRALRKQVTSLVYASSAAIFGPDESGTGALNDDAPAEPPTHYGVFKRANEGNARVYFLEQGLTSVGLRPSTVYGVGRDFGMTSEPTKAILAVATGQKFQISYGGLQDFQYAADVADAFVRCLDQPHQGAHAYNLRGSVVEVAAFCRTLAEVAPESADLITHGDRTLPMAADLSDERWQRDFGPTNKTALADGIRQTLARFRTLRATGRL